MRLRSWALIVGLCSSSFVVACSGTNPSTASTVWPACLSGDAVIVVRGTFNPPGDKLLTLEPIQRHDWRSRPTPCQQDGHFAIEVEFQTGGVSRVLFDALIADDSYPGGVKHGFFEVVVPVNEVVSWVRIVDADNEVIFAAVRGSEILQ